MQAYDSLTEVQLRELTHEQYRMRPLGGYLDRELDKVTDSGKRFTPKKGNSETINDKLGFAQRACEVMGAMSWDDLTEDAQGVTMTIFNFIVKQNGWQDDEVPAGQQEVVGTSAQ